MRPTTILATCLALLSTGVFAAEGGDKRPGLNPEKKAEAVKKFDGDGDGKLNEAERAAAREAFESKREEKIAALKEKHPKAFTHFDKNGDGKLDQGEREAARKHLAEAKAHHDVDGDGKLSEEERAAAREAMGAKREEHLAKFKEKHPKAFAHFDTNGDGALDPAEREAARAKLGQHKDNPTQREHKPKPVEK